jgi:uncharacterized protein (TIGR03435 family)
LANLYLHTRDFIMAEHAGAKRIFHRQWLLAGLAAIAVPFMPAIAAAQAAPILAAQSAPAKPPLTFDVVSIKRNNSGTGNISMYSPTNGDGINLTNIALFDIVAYAYGIQSPDLLSGLPAWAKSERYDIQAKVADPDVAQFRSLNEAQRKRMIQGLLADQFKLKIHREPKSVGVYALIVAKSGPKMKEVKPGDPHPGGLKQADGTPMEGPALNGTGPGEETAQEVTMDFFAGSLSGLAGRQVIDKTELKGAYDFKLRFSRDQQPAQINSGAESSALPPETSAPSIFVALEEQLGLKLEPQKLLVPTLVIDDVQRPSDN